MCCWLNLIDDDRHPTEPLPSQSSPSNQRRNFTLIQSLTNSSTAIQKSESYSTKSIHIKDLQLILRIHAHAPLKMTEQESAPHSESERERDPAATADANETRDEDKEDHKPRDSNGWDGKLRIDKMSLTDEPRDPHAQVVSDPEVSDDEGPPPEQLAADEDLLDDTPEDEEEIELVHCKISDMTSLRLERFKQMKVLQHAFYVQDLIILNTAASLPAPKPHRKYRHSTRRRIHTHRNRSLRQPNRAHQGARRLHRTHLARPLFQQDQAHQAPQPPHQAQRPLLCAKQD